MSKQPKRETEYRDYWQAHWPFVEFLTEKAVGTTKTRIARSMGTGDVTMHLWGKKGFTPFSAFKACMMAFTVTPEEREKWENSVVLVQGRTPSYVSRDTKILAHRYDLAHENKVFPIKGGGKHIVQLGSPPKPLKAEPATEEVLEELPVAVVPEPVLEVVALAEPQEMIIPTPMGDIRVTIPARPPDYERGTNELLIRMSQRLLSDKEQAERLVIGLRSQLATAMTELSAARITIQKQSEDLRAYEELLSGADHVIKGTAFPVMPEVEKRTKEVLKAAGASSLSTFLDSLPKTLARS